MSNYLLSTYSPLHYNFVRGEGVWLYDENGKRYLDALCGIAVTGLGHNHPDIINAIVTQSKNIIHTSNVVTIPQQIELAERLHVATDIEAKFFICNSGAEAVEGLIKLARLYGHSLNIDKPKILVFSGAFHGRTMATITASANKKVQQGFEPLLDGFVRAIYNDMESIDTIVKNESDVCAVLVEPIQGEGGVNVPEPEFLQKLRQICDQKKWLLMVDEIQTGMGRTGQMFCYQHSKVVPDAVSVAKGLANGIPIGAFGVREPHASLFRPGSHGSTFGGNPLSCAAAVATINAIRKERLWDNAAKRGEQLIEGLRKYIGNDVVDIRGQGLMIGIELDRPCRGILTRLFDEGLVCNVAAEKVIRLLPPLIIDSAQVDKIIDILGRIVPEYLNHSD